MKAVDDKLVKAVVGLARTFHIGILHWLDNGTYNKVFWR